MMIPDVMENQIWRAVHCVVVRDENFRRPEIKSPSTVFKNWLPGGQPKETNAKIALVVSASKDKWLLREINKPLQNCVRDFSLAARMPRPQIADAFHGTGTGQIRLVGHGTQKRSTTVLGRVFRWCCSGRKKQIPHFVRNDSLLWASLWVICTWRPAW